jgi:hypothetical protein
MTVYAHWYGGGSYEFGDLDQNLESFRSLVAAGQAFRDRREDGYSWKQSFAFVNRPAESDLTPCVDLESEMWIYFADPTGNIDPYPDRIIKFGPRGGIRIEIA